jgi:hypothetical protein
LAGAFLAGFFATGALPGNTAGLGTLRGMVFAGTFFEGVFFAATVRFVDGLDFVVLIFFFSLDDNR